MEFSVNLKVPRDPERHPPDDENQAMLDQAIGFFQAGSRCEANIRLSPNLTSSLSAPSAVCYALAIEIYFKLLLKLSAIEVSKEHGFIELFEKLNPDTKARIVERAGMTEVEFEEVIRPLSDTFVGWRYLYEKNSAWTSLTNLAWIGQILHNTIRAMNPSLGVSYENRLVLPESYKF